MEVSTHSLFLLQQLNIQREFGFLCDCTVAIGNVYFKAHRAVLAAFSNYFKMIFIHQSSECIKIQPTDIQPDIFSYLLHIMYTGVGPKQQVDQGRLQEGIKFLHAYQLYRSTGEGAQDTASDTIKMSNLYGIQISSQSANKAGLGQKDGRFCSPDGQRGGSRAEPCPTMSLEEVPSEVQRSNPSVASGEDPNPHGTSSVASGEDPEDISTRIKQERVESELSTEPRAGSPSLADENLSPGLLKDSPRALYCHYCGEHCGSHQGLREHLFSHATGSLPLVECRNQGEEPKSTEEELVSLAERPLQSFMVRRSPSAREQLEARPLEDALRQSQALSDELAAELKGGSSPHSRKRKIACAICSLRFAQRSQLQEHMYTHTGKPSRYLRYNRFCSQLIQASHHFCEGQSECVAEDVAADTQDNGSSCYSLDSEISQESIDAVVVE